MKPVVFSFSLVQPAMSTARYDCFGVFFAQTRVSCLHYCSSPIFTVMNASRTTTTGGTTRPSAAFGVD